MSGVGPLLGEDRPRTPCDALTACDECGRPFDEDYDDVVHPQHKPGCDHHWCDCPTVCADCCQDPDCPVRAEIPGQLTFAEATP